MPLENRIIEPLYICRDNLPQTNPILKGRELECEANGKKKLLIFLSEKLNYFFSLF